MKKTINRYEFINEMMSYYDGNGFSYEGLSVLFDYLEEFEESTGEELELDAVALHGQFSEMTVSDFIDYYYENEDIEAILSANRLGSVEDITSEILAEYEDIEYNSRVICVVNEYIVIVDTER